MENQRNLKRLLNVLNKKSSIINIILEQFIKSYNFIDEDPFVIPVKYTNYNISIGIYTEDEYINDIHLGIGDDIEYILEIEKELDIIIKVDEFISNPFNFFSSINKDLNEILDALISEIKKNTCSFCYRIEKECCSICKKYEAKTIECPICFDDTKKDLVVSLPCCRNDIHVLCLNSWYKSNESCPLCRNEDYIDFIEEIKRIN